MLENDMHINWYPGHMKKSIDKIKASLNLCDIVVELVDARIPVSSRNPVLSDILSESDKKRMIVLTKTDLSDEVQTDKWIKYFRVEEKIEAIKVNSLDSKGVDRIYPTAKNILKDKLKKDLEKDIISNKIRMMIVGIPNVGKSTLINVISKRRGTRVGNTPGVTRQNQWIKTPYGMDLLDTPGVLWPRLDGDMVAYNLAFTGAIKDEIMDVETLCFKFLEHISKDYFLNIKNRYKLKKDHYDQTLELMDEIAKNRGAILRGNEIDYFKVSNIVLTDFRKGALGNITLEKVDV